jgi:hypothetical protein
MRGPRWILTVDETERNVILDALGLAAESPGWDQADKELAEKMHDELTNAPPGDRRRARSH